MAVSWRTSAAARGGARPVTRVEHGEVVHGGVGRVHVDGDAVLGGGLSAAGDGPEAVDEVDLWPARRASTRRIGLERLVPGVPRHRQQETESVPISTVGERVIRA